ncbi:MAG: hypothetical protein ACI4L8_04045, partial [Candidatus Fimadaptatus sp.]
MLSETMDARRVVGIAGSRVLSACGSAPWLVESIGQAGGWGAEMLPETMGALKEDGLAGTLVLSICGSAPWLVESIGQAGGCRGAETPP